MPSRRTPPNPQPPSPEEAARIVNAAWADPDWGTLIWLAMVTGLRRGELCAIRWRHLDLAHGVLHLEMSIGQLGKETWEKDAKTHADRRIVLDPETLELLNEHRLRAEARAAAIGTDLSDEAFLFSLAKDSMQHLLPDSVTQKYSNMVKRLGIKDVDPQAPALLGDRGRRGYQDRRGTPSEALIACSLSTAGSSVGASV